MDEANLVRGPNYGQKQLGSREANSTLTPGEECIPASTWVSPRDYGESSMPVFVTQTAW